MWRPEGGLDDLALAAGSMGRAGGQASQGSEGLPSGTQDTNFESSVDVGPFVHGDDDPSLFREYQKEGQILEARRAAARAIVPGCEHWNVKSLDWPRGKLKPDAAALEYEIMRRDANRRPKGWSVHKKCEWLYQNAPPDAPPSQEEPDTQQFPAGPPPASQEPEINTSSRWSSASHGPRLWHAIAADKDGFLHRDEKPENR